MKEFLLWTVATILAGLLALLIGGLANAAEFFETKAAALDAAHGRHISWICTGEARLYYIGKAGERHCTDRKGVVPSENRRSKKPRLVEASRRSFDTRPVSATPAEEPHSAMMRIAVDLRWRRALGERLNEWFYVHDKSTCVPPQIVLSFNDRFSPAVPEE